MNLNCICWDLLKQMRVNEHRIYPIAASINKNFHVFLNMMRSRASSAFEIPTGRLLN